MSLNPKNKTHRLLRRQIKNAKFSAEQLEQMSEFLEAVNLAYVDSDTNHRHLENILEQSSQELYIANKNLESVVADKEKEIIIAKSQLNNIVENIDDIIFETDLDGYYTYLNSVWEKITGYKVKDSLGKHFTDFVEILDKEFFNEIKHLKPESFDAFNRVFKINSEEGSKWMESRVQLLHDQDGNAKGFTGTYQNITSLKETELKLIEVSSVKDEFLSTMSHEIRTPLNAVIGMSNMLMIDNPKPEQLDTLNALKFSSEHLLNLVNDILDVNKLRAGKLKLRNEEFDLKQTLIGLKDSFTYNTNAKGIDLHFVIDDQIPEHVIGDQLRISQVLTNLLGNAIKFVEQGSVTLTCKVLDERANYSKIFFEVTDTGIGIPEEKLDLIFEKFTQADFDTAKKYGGTGLGLTLCKGFLDQYDSKLYVTSEVGKGSKFSFTLDLEKSQCCQETINKSKTENKESIKGLNILIVEDNPLNVMVIENYFGLWEVNFEVAVNGQEAIDKISSAAFDLVLMDLRMPTLDGYEATKRIRTMEGGKYKELPIIALSASVSTEVVQKVKAVGMNDYMVKPFDPDDLADKISSHATKDLFVHKKTYQKKEVPKVDNP